MKRVNDIFYSLQGEGRNTGRAALFVRFAGCNLKCSFCDTDFASYHELSEDYIMAELVVRCMDLGLTNEKPMVVLTGGEPTLQVDEDFVDLLHEEDFYVAMESNGILPAPRNLDWLTVSPKGDPPPTPPQGKEVG
jgi:organic radical activating enzyme